VSRGQLVSILIPAWGCRPYIREAIDSALTQTHRAIEVVVVEDAGDDGTYEEALGVSDTRLRVVRNERNLGQFGNKNRAISLARSDIVKILDGDDVLEPFCVERLLDAYQEGGSGIGAVFARFSTIDASGKKLGHPRRWGFQGVAKGCEVLGYVTTLEMPGSMFGNVTPHLFCKRSLLDSGGFPSDNAGPGDLETLLRLLVITDVVFIEDTVARYRIHPKSMGHRTFGVRECADYVTMVENLEAFFRLHSLSSAPHLLEARFLRRWRVWAGSHVAFACYLRSLRGLPSPFDEVREMYESRGLGEEFSWLLRTRFLRYLLRSVSSKTRQNLGLPTHADLFSKKVAERIRR
jgi:glycosyltransferase involved in cell wall biosynthesis